MDWLTSDLEQQFCGCYNWLSSKHQNLWITKMYTQYYRGVKRADKFIS